MRDSGPAADPGSAATESACGGDREIFENTLINPVDGTKIRGLCQASRGIGVGFESGIHQVLAVGGLVPVGAVAGDATWSNWQRYIVPLN